MEFGLHLYKRRNKVSETALFPQFTPRKQSPDKLKRHFENEIRFGEKITQRVSSEMAIVVATRKGLEINSETKVQESTTSDNSQKNIERSRIKICLTSCRYECIRRVASMFGMLEVAETEPWHYYWTDNSVTIEKCKEMNKCQRINHFPGMLEICRKDLLARNLNRMQKMYPKEYNFFPKTWSLPLNYNEAINYSKSRKNTTYIIKPECGSQGRGIYLTKSLKDIRPTDRLICQVYIAKPYLLDGYKFDIRVYALITSCDPLRVFVYDEGLVRFATNLYSDPNEINSYNDGNVSDVYMHLTNYSINKHSRMYVHDEKAGSKRKISTMNKILKSHGVDLCKLWQKVDQVIVKTVVAAWPALKHSYHACFNTHDQMPACFEILGFDILLDQKLHPYLLEVNHSPSFHTDTQLDREVKEALLTDTFTMLNIWQCDGRTEATNDQQENEGELSKEDPYSAQAHWEDTHLGGFRRVCPDPKHDIKNKDGDCSNVLKENADHVKQRILEGVRSPKRDLKQEDKTCNRLPAHSIRVKEESPSRRKKRNIDGSRPTSPVYAASVPDDSVLAPSAHVTSVAANSIPSSSVPSPSIPAGPVPANTIPATSLPTNSVPSPSVPVNSIPASSVPATSVPVNSVPTSSVPSPSVPARSLPASRKSPQVSPTPVSRNVSPSSPRRRTSPSPVRRVVSRSFEPNQIDKTQEHQRLSMLAKRDFLVRSHGLSEVIYFLMKQAGTLKEVDEKKYGSYGILEKEFHLPRLKKRNDRIKYGMEM